MKLRSKLALFLLLLSNAVHAESVAKTNVAHPQVSDDHLWDMKVGFNARTYPIGAQLLFTGGYNLRLWGDTNTWKYGYLRTAFNAATSVVVNRVGGEVQFFPISILGFSAGYDWGTRNITMKFLDCGTYECNGRIDRKYLKVNAVAAYKGVIFSFMGRYENLRAPVANKPFFDEVTLLVGRSSGEDTVTWNPALLYTLNDTWKVGVTSLYSRAVESDDYTHLYGPVANYTPDWSKRFGEWNIIAGAGLNRSPVVHSGITGFLVMSYAIQPSLAVSEMSLRFRN